MGPDAPPHGPRRGHCPDCGPAKLADVVGYHCESWDDPESSASGAVYYRILKCRGCDEVYFQSDAICSEDVDYDYDPHTGMAAMAYNHTITHWPTPQSRKPPGWAKQLFYIDNNLHSLFVDIYTAFNSALTVLAAIGIRTAFDRASELLGVDPARTFDQKLQALFQSGKIGADEQRQLGVLTDAGGAAAHRGWRPELGEIETMLDLIENFLKRAFILDDAVRKLQGSVPARQPR